MKTISSKVILVITGAFIREKRKQLGYNSNGIAVAAKVSQPVISNIERGKYPGLKYETLYAILQFLGVSMSDLDDYAKQWTVKTNEITRTTTNL